MSRSSIICVDASVVVRLTLDLDDISVRELWDSWLEQKKRLVAPSLLYYEVTNALFRLERSDVYASNLVRDVLDFALTLPIELIQDKKLHQGARELAKRYQLPATYDAHYVALAEGMKADFWTADKRLFNALIAFEVDWAHLIMPSRSG